MSSSRITITDVAKRAGVSIATVSRFLNNSFVKEKNRVKVERAVRELDYEPFIFARHLAGGRLDVFGLIIPGYEGVFYSFYALEIIREVAFALNQKAIDLHLNIFWNKDTFKASLVDGIIMADVIGNEKQLERFIKKDIPLVIVNRKMDHENVNFVAVNNFKGAYEATEFLINHGHNKIAHLAGDLNVQCAKERLDGYEAALKKNGIKVKDNYIKVTNFSRKEAQGKVKELFASKSAPTAIFCCSDEVASEVLSFAEKNNIRIPKQLSLIGFDDNPRCILDDLMLTTIRQPFKTMVNHAVNILSDNIKGKKKPKRIILNPEIVIGDTVGFL